MKIDFLETENLTVTELMLLDVVTEIQIPVSDKAFLVRHYEPVISDEAMLLLCERIMFVEKVVGLLTKKKN